MDENTEYIQVDSDAGLPIRLERRLDSCGKPFFIGKLQFPGTLDLSGLAFKAFLSEEGAEELEVIVPSDNESNFKGKVSGIRSLPGRLHIPMQPRLENGETVYLGVVSSPVTMSVREGIFITLFVQEGREELQISRLRFPRYQSRSFDSTG